MLLAPLAALRRHSPPYYMSSNARQRGLDGVVAAQTRLSHVDGLAGELIIGGYQLKELAGRVSFEAAAHLLWHGALPSRDELKVLSQEIAGLRALPEETMHVVRAAAKAPPIDALRMACATLSLDLQHPDDISAAADMQAAKMLTARFPTVVAAHARLMSAVTGAIGALKGPLHGGAPGPVLDMLKDIKSADRAEAWVRNELAAGRRIMGFGHRVYKVRDPRAEVLSSVADKMSSAALENQKLFELARAAEQTILKVLDEVKPGRSLRTNVEFFTALVLQALGLEPRTFVATFACGRVAGWCAHVIEQHAEDHLIRPQSEYVGPKGLKVD